MGKNAFTKYFYFLFLGHSVCLQMILDGKSSASFVMVPCSEKAYVICQIGKKCELNIF